MGSHLRVLGPDPLVFEVLLPEHTSSVIGRVGPAAIDTERVVGALDTLRGGGNRWLGVRRALAAGGVDAMLLT